MDKLLALRAFKEVAEIGGFSKAARRLGVATSSLTRQLDALEASLGSALLTRTTRQVTLTDAGSTYLEHVSRVLSDLDEADGAVADTGAEAVGPLRVSMPVTFGRLCVGPHIAGFLESHPRVSLELVLSDEYVDLAAERIDVAVRIGSPENQPHLIVKPLGAHHRYVVASRAYLERHPLPVEPGALSQHECVLFAYRAGPQRWSFSGPGGVQGVEVNGPLSANSSDVLREAVLGGLGVALLPQWLVEKDVVAGRLQRLFEEYEVNPLAQAISVHAAYLPNRRHSRKVQAMLEFLQRHVALPVQR